MMGDEFAMFCTLYQIQHSFNSDGQMLFSQTSIERIKSLTPIYDAKNGGLVVGKSHLQGGVHIIQPVGPASYSYVGEMEDGEYISSYDSSPETLKEFAKINSIKDAFNQVLPPNFPIIDLSENNIQIIMISEFSHFIINKWSTKSHYNEILKLI